MSKSLFGHECAITVIVDEKIILWIINSNYTIRINFKYKYNKNKLLSQNIDFDYNLLYLISIFYD